MVDQARKKPVEMAALSFMLCFLLPPHKLKMATSKKGEKRLEMSGMSRSHFAKVHIIKASLSLAHSSLSLALHSPSLSHPFQDMSASVGRM